MKHVIVNGKEFRQFSKREFLSWVRKQGQAGYNSGDQYACAMTQFGRAKMPNVERSFVDGVSLGGEVANKYAILVDARQNPIGWIDLNSSEVFAVIRHSYFPELLEALK
jgi:endo-beta-N-acetylglucosaminidase D